jgi:hypothetical protein
VLLGIARLYAPPRQAAGTTYKAAADRERSKGQWDLDFGYFPRNSLCREARGLSWIGRLPGAHYSPGEEMDFCIRLLNSGYIVRLGFGDPIVHHEVPLRDWRRMDCYGRRNDIVFAWRNVPMPYLPAHLAATTFNGLICAIRTKRPSTMISGILSGYLDMCLNLHWRQPVSQSSYRLHRLLKKHGPRNLDDIEPLLPRLAWVGAGLSCARVGHACAEQV